MRKFFSFLKALWDRWVKKPQCRALLETKTERSPSYAVKDSTETIPLQEFLPQMLDFLKEESKDNLNWLTKIETGQHELNFAYYYLLDAFKALSRKYRVFSITKEHEIHGIYFVHSVSRLDSIFNAARPIFGQLDVQFLKENNELYLQDRIAPAIQFRHPCIYKKDADAVMQLIKDWHQVYALSAPDATTQERIERVVDVGVAKNIITITEPGTSIFNLQRTKLLEPRIYYRTHIFNHVQSTLNPIHAWHATFCELTPFDDVRTLHLPEIEALVFLEKRVPFNG